MRKIKELEYSTFGYLSSENEKLVITRQGDLSTVIYELPFCYDAEPKVIYLTATESAEIAALVESIGINDWDDRYENRNILDGEEWKIKVTYEDGEAREIIGVNAHPEGWHRFETLVEHIKEKWLRTQACQKTIHEKWEESEITILPPREKKLTKKEIMRRLGDPNLPGEEIAKLIELLYEGIDIKGR